MLRQWPSSPRPRPLGLDTRRYGSLSIPTPRTDLHISLTGHRLVTGQLYRQLRDAILDGRLRSGEPLPSSRELATRLAISRNTVLAAFERLWARGFLGTHAGAGTFVRPGIRPRPGRPPAPP